MAALASATRLLVAPSLASFGCACSHTVRHVSSATASSAPSIVNKPVRTGHRVSVVLKQQLDNLGTVGEEVQVAPGYARNYLIPRQLAVYGTELNRARYKVDLPPAEAAAKAAERAQNMLKKRIASVTLLFARATSDGSTLYGAITKADIVEILADTPLRNLKIKEANIRLNADPAAEQTLKQVGDHVIEIEPARAGYPGVWCKLKVRVSSS